MQAARLALVAMTAALLATALPVAAEEGRLTAGAVEYDSKASQSGDLAMLFASDSVLDERGQLVEGARPWIDLQAAAISAVEYEDTRQEASFSPVPFSAQGPSTAKDPVPSEYAAAHAYLTESQPGFQLHVYSVDGTIAYSLDTASGLFKAAEEAFMSPGQFSARREDHQTTKTPSTFAFVERPGPWVVHYETAPKLSVTLQGDFTVEMTGITLQVQGESGEGTLRSGAWKSPIDPNAPQQASEAAYTMTKRFVRMQLTGAMMEFATEGGSPILNWASTGVSTDFTGRAALVDARGDMHTAAGVIPLRHERYVLPEASRVLLQPQPGGDLLVDVSPSPVGPNGGTVASVAAPASAALIGTGAVLALGIAVGLGVLRRLLRLPALADVETALEEGEYRKAARLAGRILSRLPGSEEALLGRAIALSKSGRHQDVVAELTRHLALRPASDGTLHYVLGLAQLESGREGEGKASLREAVRLTPSLQAEVAPRLGKAFSVAQPTTRETNGYA